MKRQILLLLILGQAVCSFAQTSSEGTELKTLFKADIGPQGIGFSFEPKLGKKTTIDLSLGAGGGYDVWESGVDYQWNIFQPAFYFSATPKFYYHRQKRIDNGKISRLNSGNYIGLRVKYTTPSVAPNDPIRDALLVNVHWGIQRAIANHWIFNSHAGAGYAQDLTSEFGTIYLAVDFKFSYVF